MVSWDYVVLAQMIDHNLVAQVSVSKVANKYTCFLDYVVLAQIGDHNLMAQVSVGKVAS